MAFGCEWLTLCYLFRKLFYTVLVFEDNNIELHSVLIGEPIAGALLGKDKDAYWRMFVLTGITAIVGSFFIFIAKVLISKKIFTKV